MRARHPDSAGHVVRDGVRLGYEVFGSGEPTVLLLPTWTIVHSRIWKMQVPYLSRDHRVVTYDGPGNGRSDRSTDPERYTADAYAADAGAVLEHLEVDRAVVVGVSLGAAYAVRLAVKFPGRVLGLVLVGPALPLTPQAPERAQIAERFQMPYPDDPQGWDKYNAAYWRDQYEDFAGFFFGQCFSEPHSTKPTEDAVEWALETTPEILLTEARESRGRAGDDDWSAVLAGLDCPTLVVHGTGDRVQPHARGVEAARLTGGTLLSMEGSGHLPHLRDPVRFNLALRRFIEDLAA